MDLSINGQSQVPPGFRFHPTEEELLHYYLRKKVAYEKIDLDVIREVDLNKLEPWDIQERCKIGSTPQNDWYFFSHKDKKYPTGTRTNRATAAGFWKATGRDKIIYSGFRRIGLRKTLVFYKGRAPHGQKSDWIMHEYRLDDSNHDPPNTTGCNSIGDAIPEEGWVVCRVFRKKNYQKSLESPKGTSSGSMDSKTQILNSGNDAVLDQILLYMGRTCKMENLESFNSNNINICNNNNNTTNNNNYVGGFLSGNNSTTAGVISEALHEKFMHLPRLELDSPSLSNSVPINSPSLDHHQERSLKSGYQPYDDDMLTVSEYNHESAASASNQGNGVYVSGGFDIIASAAGSAHHEDTKSGHMMSTDWVTLDRLVASQLNGQVLETPKQFSCCFSDHHHHHHHPDPNTTSFGLSPDDDDDMQLSQLHSHESHQANDNHLWTFKRSSPSSSDPLCHLSV